MASPPKILMVGLDACDARTVRALADRGQVPTIAALLERAAQVPTVAPVGVYEGAVWPTMFTALSATKHGYYCFEEQTPGTYEHHPTSPRDTAGTPFWHTLSDAGKRVAVIDVPHTVISGPLNGIQVVEYGCHDRHVGFSTWPPSLAEDIEQRFGLHPIGGIDAHTARQFAPCDVVHRAGGPRRTHDEARALFADLLAGLEAKRKLSLHYLDQGDWDVFVTVLGEGHCTGHQFWALHDPSEPSHDPALAAELGDPVAEVYSRLDDELAEHLERAGPDTSVFVVMSHGMGQMNSGVFLIDAVLRRLAEAESSGPRGRRSVRAVKRMWNALPAGARRRLGPAMARLVRRRLPDSPDGLAPYHDLFDRCPGCSAASELLDGQPWYVVPNNTVCAGVRMNITGREPRGVVAPGATDQVAEQLAADLLDIVKVETGEPLVLDVMRASDHYERVEPDGFPDVLVEWDRRSPTHTVYSPKIGVVHEPYEHWRTGDHFPNGLLLATGPGIVPGVASQVIPVTDIAPTICARLGVQLPDVDGHVIPGLSADGPADAVLA